MIVIEFEKARKQLGMLAQAVGRVAARFHERLSIILPPLRLAVAKERAFRSKRNTMFYSKKSTQRKNWKKWKKRK